MKPSFFFFIFISIFVSTCTNSSTTTAVAGVHNRRTLHQPFFPLDSPGVPPSSSDAPFPPNPTTTASPPENRPFFPDIPSPPPPPPATPTASFPANISSLNLPNSPKSKPVSSKLIATAVTLVIAAAIVIAIVVYLQIQKRRRSGYDSRSFSEEKTHRSDSSSRIVANCNVNNRGDAGSGSGGGSGGSDSDVNRIPKLNRPSQSSAEFLYLGTLVSSHGGINAMNAIGIENRVAVDSNLRKLDSPELRPLPPLGSVGGGGVRSQSNLRNNNFDIGDVESSKDEEFEEFYSPRSSVGTGSGTRPGYETRRLIGSGSSSCSSSSSGSPVRSVSLIISPPVSLSPIRSRPKSPELFAIQTAPPPSRSAPPPPPPPPPPPQPLVIPSLHFGISKDSVESESSPRLLDSSSDRNSPAPAAGIPPPPPPPPPRKHWENSSPKTQSPPIKPPVLITPPRLIPLINDQPLVSPIEMLPENQENVETPKPKLKPLHWDKVRTSSDREMVWDQLKTSSFKLNEEMIETLFIVKTPNSTNSNQTTTTNRPILPSPMSQETRVLDPKKSQNIAISLRALNVTIEEVCDALLEGNADTLGTEVLESLLKMAPTKEEERKLIEYKDDTPVKLGPAEKFLKAILDVPFAFKRVDAMLYVSNFEPEVEYLKRSFQTLELACEELRNSRMFLKLLEAVLKTGNRMNVGTNRGDAQAFKLDTLLKLIDVKGTDGKTTLLHFVVQEIIKSEGSRLSTLETNPDTPTPNSTVANDAKCRKMGLQVVASISSELSNVKKAASMDSEVLNSDVTKLSEGISVISQVVRVNEGITDSVNKKRFLESMNSFVKTAEEEIIRVQAQESVAFSLVKEITEYFHGNSAKEEAHPFRIFTVVRDFVTVLDRVCKEVGSINKKTVISSGYNYKFPVPVNPNLNPKIPMKRQCSSSDDELP